MKTKTKIKELGNRAAAFLCSARAKLAFITTSIMLNVPMIVCAQDPATGGGKDANNIVETIAGVVVDIFPLIGIFFVLAGVFKLVMAYRSDNPEGQTSAAKDIVIGAVFIVFRVFVWNKIKGAIL